MAWILGGAAVLAAWRAVSLAVWPCAPCRRCGGGRRNPGSNQRRWGRCPGCGGTGERLRFGAAAVHRALGRRGR